MLTRKKPRSKDRTIQTKRMWNVKTKVIPVITGESGTIPKSFRIYPIIIPGKHDIGELQETVILGTAPTLREVQNIEHEK